MVVYGDCLTFGISLKWLFVEMQILVLLWLYFSTLKVATQLR